MFKEKTEDVRASSESREEALIEEIASNYEEATLMYHLPYGDF